MRRPRRCSPCHGHNGVCGEKVHVGCCRVASGTDFGIRCENGFQYHTPHGQIYVPGLLLDVWCSESVGTCCCFVVACTRKLCGNAEVLWMPMEVCC